MVYKANIINHTENMLKKNKHSVRISDGLTKKIKIFGKKSLENFSLKVPGDPSSAAFFTAST